MKENDKVYTSSISLLIGCILLILGILIIVFKDLYYHAINVLLMLMIANGFIQIVEVVLKKRNKNFLLYALVNVFGSIFLLFFPFIPRAFFPVIFAVYMIICALAKFINFILFKRTNDDKWLIELIESILLLGLGLSILFFPISWINILLIGTGIYFIILGVSFILHVAIQFMPNRHKNKIKINLPLWLEAIIPYIALSNLNYLLLSDDKHDKKENNKVNSKLEIMIHTSNNGFNKIGHIDICYNGTVISYGNYDDSSKRYKELVGDGVLFKAPKDKYIPFCIKHSKKVLFGFGINLTEKQDIEIQNKIKELEKSLISWNPPCIFNVNDNKDYASCLYNATKAKMYKFKGGKFKTYFVLGVSCCDLANEIIGISGIDILKMNGFISPGTYYDCLNREYMANTGLVLYRNVYTKDNYDKVLNRK